MVNRSGQEMKAIADASFLIGLCKIEKADLLGKVFEEVLIPPEVYKEVVERGKERVGAQKVRKADCISIQEPKNKRLVSMFLANLGPGEAEVLVLAQEQEVDLLLLDEIKARKLASIGGFRVMGLLGFLLAAKNLGFVSKLSPLITELRNKGFRISDEVIDEILQKANER